MSDTSNHPYSALYVDSYPQSINQSREVTLPESSSHLPYQHSTPFLQSPSQQSEHVHDSHVSIEQSINRALDAQSAPIIPVNAVGTGAHDNCSPTCVLSHPRRSASIYVCILVAITCLVTGSLISLKAFRGNVPGAHVNPLATFTQTPSIVVAVDSPGDVTFSDPVVNETNIPPPTVSDTVYDRLESVFHNAAPTIQSANPKVPIDENDMTSSMLLLGWGLSPLLSAVITIAWTYLKYRKNIRVPNIHSGEQVHEIPAQSDLHRDVSELRLHHHHPMFVNPSPQDETEASNDVISSSQTLPENDLIASSEHSNGPPDLVISPPLSLASRSSTLGASGLDRSLLLSPNSRAISAPMLPSAQAASRTLSAQGCPRPHRVAPFYSRPKQNRGWFWWIPRSRAQLTTLLRPFGRFMLRCYFVPIMVPTIGAVLQYAFSCCLGFTGFLSPVFVPELTSALSLPSTKTAELWSVTLAFFYELLFGVWWDPFPPGSADWGRGMDFSGASWMAISAMEEIGWAGLLFPCLYEIWPKNPTRASIVTGIIWSAWHWPMLVFGQMNLFPEAAAYHPGLLSTPFFYGFVTFTLSTTFSRVIMVRLLLFSDDLWSQCVYHAAHNVMVFNFFAQLPDVDNTRYPHAGLFIAEAGIPLVTMYTSLALFIIYRWRTAEQRKTRALAASHGIPLTEGEPIDPVHHQIIEESATTEELQFYPRAKSPDEIQMQARNDARIAMMSPVAEESPQYQSFSTRPSLAGGSVQTSNSAIDMSMRRSVRAN